MDTSKEYIQMCWKVEEIQEAWQFKEGDWFTTLGGVRTGESPCLVDKEWIRDNEDRGKTHKDYQPDWIWLPRQDQLQEMCITGNATASELVNRLVYMVRGPDGVYYECYWSMEQLWLAFVMKEKYGKIWKDGEWVCA